MLVGSEPKPNGVASLYQLGALHARSADLDLAPFDRVGSESACFKKTRGPKPFVESNFGPLFTHSLRWPPPGEAAKPSDANQPAWRQRRHSHSHRSGAHRSAQPDRVSAAIGIDVLLHPVPDMLVINPHPAGATLHAQHSRAAVELRHSRSAELDSESAVVRKITGAAGRHGDVAESSARIDAKIDARSRREFLHFPRQPVSGDSISVRIVHISPAGTQIDSVDRGDAIAFNNSGILGGAFRNHALDENTERVTFGAGRPQLYSKHGALHHRRIHSHSLDVEPSIATLDAKDILPISKNPATLDPSLAGHAA